MEATPGSNVRVDIVHGGDAAQHQRRVQELVDQLADAVILDIVFTTSAEPNSRIGIGYSTMVISKTAE